MVQNMDRQDRRSFVRRAAGLAGASLAGGRALNANDRIRIALIGCGGRGRADLANFLSIPDVECAALCDVDQAQIAAASKQVMQRAGRRPDLLTQDFRRVLERNDVDAVIVATPDHWHALPTILACEAGKDVYVEKPLSLTIAEGRAMVGAATRHRRIVQMGNQRRSSPHYRAAVEYVHSGKLGAIRMVRAWAYLDQYGDLPPVADSDAPEGVDYDFWLGPAPKRAFNRNRFHFDFRWYWDYAGGLATDWGAHQVDIALWGMKAGTPLSAVSTGGKPGYPASAMETPDTQQTLWQFPGFTLLWEHALGVARGPEARPHGVAFHGSEGMLVVDAKGWEVFPESGRNGRRGPAKSLPAVPLQTAPDLRYDAGHVKNFLDCMRSRERPNSVVEIGHNTMIACHLGNIAFRLKRAVRWDAERETIPDDAEARKYLSREYRAPWRLPA